MSPVEAGAPDDMLTVKFIQKNKTMNNTAMGRIPCLIGLNTHLFLSCFILSNSQVGEGKLPGAHILRVAFPIPSSVVPLFC